MGINGLSLVLLYNWGGGRREWLEMAMAFGAEKWKIFAWWPYNNIELFREGGSAPCYITQLHDGEDDILADVLFFEVPRRVES